MIELKLRNPTTNLFEEVSVGSLTTARKINGVDFNGTADITIDEKEIVISNTTPVDSKNKLWISNLPGQVALPLTVDWPNVTNKPNWLKPNSIQSIETVTNNIIFNERSSIYNCVINTNTTFALSISPALLGMLTNAAFTFELHLNMTTISTLTWPVNLTWIGGSTPAFNTVKKYAVVLRTMDAGTTWIANLAYTY